jgi:hypothetical protein
MTPHFHGHGQQSYEEASCCQGTARDPLQLYALGDDRHHSLMEGCHSLVVVGVVVRVLLCNGDVPWNRIENYGSDWNDLLKIFHVL